MTGFGSIGRISRKRPGAKASSARKTSRPARTVWARRRAPDGNGGLDRCAVPYVFVGGRIEAEGTERPILLFPADGKSVARRSKDNLDKLFSDRRALRDLQVPD